MNSDLQGDPPAATAATDRSGRTIRDFGRQWTLYPDNDGYYASPDLFADICGPLLPTAAFRDATVADIGGGTGRIVRMLLDSGAARVVSLEPSEAFEALKRNTADVADRVECLRATGDALPRDRGFDYVVSIGVLHHIADPAPVVRAAFEALRPGGRLLVWLYGREGNESYLRLIGPLRAVTTRLPHAALAAVAHVLNAALDLYLPLCRRFPLPLSAYANNVIGRFSRQKRFLVIYDQLNPAVARYYTGDEARALLETAGFRDVRPHHRHGYSWTVIGTRP